MGSVLAYGGPKGVQWVDVYVYETNPEGKSSQRVCIRLSDRPSDYLSVGTVLDLLISANRSSASDGISQAAAALIDFKFCIRAIRT